MNPLVVMGFGEHEQADIKNDPWDLVYQLVLAGIPMTADDVAECVQNNTERCLTRADLLGRTQIFVYSWALESLRQTTDNFATLGEDVFLYIVLGVEDPTGITEWSIDLGKFRGRAVCFFLGPNLAFPVDLPIKNAPTVDFSDTLLLSPNVQRLNVNLRPLAKPVPWYLGWVMPATKVWNHTHVMNNTQLLALLTRQVINGSK